MSTQDLRKLSSVLRSIEIIEEKTNAIHCQYTTSINEHEHLQSIIIGDSNVHLQIFFQHLEQLLQLDLKNRASILNNNKRNYWNFFSLALKESKGLYDTVLYVLNSQEVKTSIGRGRLFLRFCLQNHRLGDVIQQSFMMPKLINQFYIDECFWTTPAYFNRIMQSLYQLNDIQFDLLSTSQYQLDICWPTTESIDTSPKTVSDTTSRLRNDSVSSYLSMNSIDSQSIISVARDVSSSISVHPSPFQHLGSSTNDGSSAQSLSSVDEDPENTLMYWKDKCRQLENQCQDLPTNDVEIQCTITDNQPKEQIIECNHEDLLNQFKDKNEELKTNVNTLKEEINNLNFQLSSISMQSTTSTDKLKDYERARSNYQTLIETKDILIQELQNKFDEQTSQFHSIQDHHLLHCKEQEKRIELLQIEVEKSIKSLENERILIEKERADYRAVQEQLEASIQEKTLDFEEMKRRLVKAVREKADLFNSIHSYEIKLEEEQCRRWMADEEAIHCMKCHTLFGWTLRKHHCRHCQKIFCYYCSNNWIANSKTNSPQYRVCDYCNEKLLKESLMPSEIIYHQVATTDDVDLRFEVRAERLPGTTDNPNVSLQ